MSSVFSKKLLQSFFEKEIRLYNLARFRETLQELQLRSRTTPPEKLPELLAQALGAIEEFTMAAGCLNRHDQKKQSRTRLEAVRLCFFDALKILA